MEGFKEKEITKEQYLEALEICNNHIYNLNTKGFKKGNDLIQEYDVCLTICNDFILQEQSKLREEESKIKEIKERERLSFFKSLKKSDYLKLLEEPPSEVYEKDEIVRVTGVSDYKWESGEIVKIGIVKLNGKTRKTLKFCFLSKGYYPRNALGYWEFEKTFKPV